MKISYSCLKEYIDFNLSPQEISNKLTLAGLEVESMLGKNESDAVLEVNITPNRPDCLSLIGIARELSALTGYSVKYPDDKIEKIKNDVRDLPSVTVLDRSLCPRYSARLIQGIKVKPSPQWLIDKLEIVGIRSINNIVDITNFVLIELGHPLHAFDYDLIGEKKIIVRRGIKGEKFQALGNIPCEIDDSMLVIADSSKPIALAGIIGGKNTEVSESTTNILLESAYFEPVQIRRSSKKLGVQTESSYRFERGANPESVLNASNRATMLILQLAGGEANQIIDIYPSVLVSKEIILRLDRVNKILGANLSEGQIKNYMKNLGFSYLQKKVGHYKIKPPSFRRDILREIDLIEEIARLHGYDDIKVESPQYKISKVNLNPFYSFIKKAKTYFQGKGFYEAINYSFVNKELQDAFQDNDKEFAKDDLLIQNPISNEWGVMRKSLIPGLLSSTQLNINKGIEDVQLFEVGRHYSAANEEENSSGGNTHSLPPNTTGRTNKKRMSEEVCFLGGIATSKVKRELWKKEIHERDLFYLKGIIEIFLENIDFKKYLFKRSFAPSFENLIYLFAGENQFGFIGCLSQRITEKWGIKDRLLAFEINLDMLYKNRENSTMFQPISKYPGLLRDLAILVNREIHAEEIEKFIKENGTPLLKEVTLFDCYEGKSIPAGKKSLAYSLQFGDDTKTLRDEDVDSIFNNLLKGFAEKFDVHLRPE